MPAISILRFVHMQLSLIQVVKFLMIIIQFSLRIPTDSSANAFTQILQRNVIQAVASLNLIMFLFPSHSHAPLNFQLILYFNKVFSTSGVQLSNVLLSNHIM